MAAVLDEHHGGLANQGITSVLRALDMIELVAHADGEVGVTELAARCGMHKSSVSRIMATLALRGYVRQNPDTGRYTLGLHLAELGSACLAKVDMRQVAKPYIEELRRETGETVHLAVIMDSSMVYIDKSESEHVLGMKSRVGASVPLHCTGLGKALCAFLPEDFVLARLQRAGMTKFTSNTITDVDDFLACLARIRECGYAFDDEEHEEGIRCVAVPVMDHAGRAVAAVSASGPTVRVSRERLHEMIPLVAETGRKISAALGLRGGGRL